LEIRELRFFSENEVFAPSSAELRDGVLALFCKPLDDRERLVIRKQSVRLFPFGDKLVRERRDKVPRETQTRSVSRAFIASIISAFVFSWRVMGKKMNDELRIMNYEQKSLRDFCETVIPNS